MNIPRDKIDEILASTNIVDVVSGFVRLKKTGRNFVGLCPFHTEKTPSFSVSAEKSLFKCFGCGRGGNVFTFLMEHQKISFTEAVMQLAERYGISLPEETPRGRKEEEGKELLYSTTQFAADFFRNVFSKPDSEEALQYLKKRKWSEETQKTFQIGYAPDEWDALLMKASASSLDLESFVTTGLLVKREDGKTYDRFRRRLIFPIHSSFGKIIGFGARAIRAGDEPKYLNSPETPIYNKSYVLYGLHQAASTIREKDSVIIVEGYADVISVHQAGLKNVVATSGTALTPEQIKLLARYTKNFFFVYDADSAGAKAMIRGVDVISEQGYDVKVVELPSGEDPDSYVQSRGGKALEEMLQTAQTFVDFIIHQSQVEGKFQTPEQKSEAIRRVVILLAKMDDELRRDFYIKHVAERYDIYESVLHRELEKQRKEFKRLTARLSGAQQVRRFDQEEKDAVVIQRTISPGERDFLSNIFQAPEKVMNEVLRFIHVEDFLDERIQQIVHVLMEQKEVFGRINIAQLEVELEDIELQRLVTDLTMPKYSVSSRWEEYQIVEEPDYKRLLFDNYKHIIAALIERLIESNQKRLKMSRDPSDEVLPLMEGYQRLMNSKQTIVRAVTFEEIEEIRKEFSLTEKSHLSV